MTETYNELPRKGEIEELREGLVSTDANKKRDTIHKVISAMTNGKHDVSSLFMEMLHSISSNDLEIKKLVYLFLTNYAQAKQDLALLAVNAFVQDASHSNPLIRALSIRTMGSIRIDTLSEYLCEPLRACLDDSDPYVRKTAALTIAKVYDVSPELIEDQGFLDRLCELLVDENHVVIANAATALSEISTIHPNPSAIFSLTSSLVSSLITALDSCTEWGQISLIDVLVDYAPENGNEASMLIERLLPRLQHRNSALVLGAVKLILRWSNYLEASELSIIEKKLTPPLVSLMSGTAEIQLVVLKSLQLIVGKKPHLLRPHYKVFFCKYNDPIYVKLEKIELLILLSCDENISAILSELCDYANEVDVDFVRKAVRSIGLIAIKLPNSAAFCVESLLDLIKSKSSHVVQEVVVVVRDIFRKYPNTFEGCIGELCSHLTSLDEPAAKSAMVWIIGEYGNRIANVEDLMEIFIDGFADETTEVQLSILTATVKCYLKKPKQIKPFLSRVFTFATTITDNPDLRDRAFVYWRLLSLSPELAKKAVLGERPVVETGILQLEGGLHEILLNQIGSLAAVLHKDPMLVARKTRKLSDQNDDDDVIGVTGDVIQSKEEINHSGDDILDLLSLDDKPEVKKESGQSEQQSINSDLISELQDSQEESTQSVNKIPEDYDLFLDHSKCGGVELYGKFEQFESKSIVLKLLAISKIDIPISNLAIQFNVNCLGLAVDSSFSATVAPREEVFLDVPIGVNPQRKKILEGIKNFVIQAAIKHSKGGPFFFAIPINLTSFLIKSKSMISKAQFIAAWSAVSDDKAIRGGISLNGSYSEENIVKVKSFINELNMNIIFSQSVSNGDLIHCAGVTIDGSAMVIDFLIKHGDFSMDVAIKTPANHLCGILLKNFEIEFAKLKFEDVEGDFFARSKENSSTFDDLLQF
ncbi:hypothetical protein P9112_013945 [Eukaryota sp. TZLM1-RC]